MRTLFALFLLSSALLSVGRAQDSLAARLSELKSAPASAHTELIDAILQDGVNLEALRTALAGGVQPAPATDRSGRLVAGWSAWEATDSEGMTRPYQLFLPAKVVAGEMPSALLVHMHGGVGRDAYGEGLGSRNATGYAGLLWPELAEEHGFVVVCPQGRVDCVWWSEAGTRHVRAVIRDVRRSISVPDQAIFGTGFSDGASGCFYLAMAAPDPFAGFISMNGHPAIGASQARFQLYLGNMAASATVAAMTQADSLYPSKSVLPHMVLAMEQGADIHLISYPKIDHRPLYFDDQTALFAKFLLETRRDDQVERLRWIASDLAAGSARWLEIRTIGTGNGDAAPLVLGNVMTTPGRVRLGIGFEPGGIQIASVSEGSTAEKVDLRVGDVIQSFDGMRVESRDELTVLLRSKTYGDSFVMETQRGDETLAISSTFPLFQPKPIYTREMPSAFMDCTLALEGDELTITISSHLVRSARIWLSSEQARGGHAHLVANGVETLLDLGTLSPREVLSRFAASGDAAATRMYYVDVTLP